MSWEDRPTMPNRREMERRAERYQLAREDGECTCEWLAAIIDPLDQDGRTYIDPFCEQHAHLLIEEPAP